MATGSFPRARAFFPGLAHPVLPLGVRGGGVLVTLQRLARPGDGISSPLHSPRLHAARPSWGGTRMGLLGTCPRLFPWFLWEKIQKKTESVQAEREGGGGDQARPAGRQEKPLGPREAARSHCSHDPDSALPGPCLSGAGGAGVLLDSRVLTFPACRPSAASWNPESQILPKDWPGARLGAQSPPATQERSEKSGLSRQDPHFFLLFHPSTPRRACPAWLPVRTATGPGRWWVSSRQAEPRAPTVLSRHQRWVMSGHSRLDLARPARVPGRPLQQHSPCPTLWQHMAARTTVKVMQ